MSELEKHMWRIHELPEGGARAAAIEYWVQHYGMGPYKVNWNLSRDPARIRGQEMQVQGWCHVTVAHPDYETGATAGWGAVLDGALRVVLDHARLVAGWFVVVTADLEAIVTICKCCALIGTIGALVVVVG